MKKLFGKDIFGGRLGRNSNQDASDVQAQRTPEQKRKSFWGKVKNFFKEAVPIALSILTVVSTVLSIKATYHQQEQAYA